jgi:hypothetical protein
VLEISSDNNGQVAMLTVNIRVEFSVDGSATTAFWSEVHSVVFAVRRKRRHPISGTGGSETSLHPNVVQLPHNHDNHGMDMNTSDAIILYAELPMSSI